MSCINSKRSLDWEHLNQRPAKRRKFNPFESSDNSSSPSGQNSLLTEPQPSPFAETTHSKISLDKMTQNIRDEIKQLHMCSQLQFSSGDLESMQDLESSESEMVLDSPRRPDSQTIVRHPEKALFTFKQVELICGSMLKKREDAIREQYDVLLATKLAEQYDVFVKFTYDQIQRRYEAAPSYLS